MPVRIKLNGPTKNGWNLIDAMHKLGILAPLAQDLHVVQRTNSRYIHYDANMRWFVIAAVNNQATRLNPLAFNSDIAIMMQQIVNIVYLNPCPP